VGRTRRTPGANGGREMFEAILVLAVTAVVGVVIAALDNNRSV
jgi:hypothetical protein